MPITHNPDIKHNNKHNHNNCCFNSAALKLVNYFHDHYIYGNHHDDHCCAGY